MTASQPIHEETLTKVNRHVLAMVLLSTSHHLPSASHVSGLSRFQEDSHSISTWVQTTSFLPLVPHRSHFSLLVEED